MRIRIQKGKKDPQKYKRRQKATTFTALYSIQGSTFTFGFDKKKPFYKV